jgi:hypothetical protein
MTETAPPFDYDEEVIDIALITGLQRNPAATQ